MHSAVSHMRRHVPIPRVRNAPSSDRSQGFHFLYYLEKLIGKPSWDTFIPHYFKTWSRKSLDSYDFKATLLDFFKPDAAASKALASVDWDSWFYKPGLPPKPEFDTSMVDKCYDLAKKWESEVSKLAIHPIRTELKLTTQSPELLTEPIRHRRPHRKPNCRLPRTHPTLQNTPHSRAVPSNGQSLFAHLIPQRRAQLSISRYRTDSQG